MVKVRPDTSIRGVFWLTVDDITRPATINLTPGRKVYGERLTRVKDREYRLWDPHRSKLAAALLGGLKEVPFGPGSTVLYLGAASGTTSSHVSDIVGSLGLVYCVEFAPRPMRDLIKVCSQRPNMVPLLEDARHPERCGMFVGEVDAIYCDVAQPDQAEILAGNAGLFLRDGGGVLFAVKARSIDATKPPKDVFQHELAILRGRDFRIDGVIDLKQYARAHVMIRATYRPA